MMHLRIIHNGSAYMYIGSRPVTDGPPGCGDVYFDEDGLPAQCLVPSRYVEKLLGRKGIEGEWVELVVS